MELVLTEVSMFVGSWGEIGARMAFVVITSGLSDMVVHAIGRKVYAHSHVKPEDAPHHKDSVQSISGFCFDAKKYDTLSTVQKIGYAALLLVAGAFASLLIGYAARSFTASFLNYDPGLSMEFLMAGGIINVIALLFPMPQINLRSLLGIAPADAPRDSTAT